jgi:Tol biopolymer transport system component
VLDKPLGLAIINLDGTIKQELRLPRDAWTADLNSNGSIVFTTVSTDVGFCGGCTPGGSTHRVAIVDVGKTTGSFVYPANGPSLETAGAFAWSPDGKRLAFNAQDDASNFDIYVLDVTQQGSNPPMIGGSVRRLTTDPAIDAFPTWTPDGKWILYDNGGATPLDDSGFSPTQEIWRVSAEGGTPQRLTKNEDADSQPDVAADGTVAYWHGGDVWTMTSTGKDQRPLAKVPAQLGFNPRWSPDGSKLALLVYDPTERAAFDLSLHLPGSLPLLKVVVVDLASGTVSEVGPRVASDANPVSWTSDGSALLVYRYDQPN